MNNQAAQLIAHFLVTDQTGVAGKGAAEHDMHGRRVAKLHGHTIAVYLPHIGQLHLNDCGFRTVTTKKWMNAILDTLAPGAKVYQHQHQWYLRTPDGIVLPWEGEMKLALPRQAA